MPSRTKMDECKTMNQTYPQRKSTRLKGYDYTQSGAYFVTICLQNRLCLFGDVTDDVMVRNPAGEMVAELWLRANDKFPDIELDHFVVMPNHFHAIVLLHADNVSLLDVVQWFKTMTTNAYIRGVKSHDWLPFEGKLWQRSFHDHIIRDEAGLNTIRSYILTNPSLWQKDVFYEG